MSWKRVRVGQAWQSTYFVQEWCLRTYCQKCRNLPYRFAYQHIDTYYSTQGVRQKEYGLGCIAYSAFDEVPCTAAISEEAKDIPGSRSGGISDAASFPRQLACGNASSYPLYWAQKELAERHTVTMKFIGETLR